MKILCLIPARYASSRFPGKPLVNICGKTMIRRVYERVAEANVGDVYVATDDRRIFDEVASFGGNAAMTGEHHSGTDRCYEVFEQLGKAYDAVINIQGDEPLIDPEQIRQLAQSLENGAPIATMASAISEPSEVFDENVVKVVFDVDGKALYFSRHAIPFQRGTDKADWFGRVTYYKHIGMYGFRADVFGKIVGCQLSELERAESLEQLRWLQNGFDIHVEITDKQNYSVDTQDDLIKIENRLKTSR